MLPSDPGLLQLCCQTVQSGVLWHLRVKHKHESRHCYAYDHQTSCRAREYICIYKIIDQPQHYSHTFLAEHAVTQWHLCKDGIFLEGSGQHRAGISRQALSTQVQSRALSSPALLELSHNTLLGLHTSLLTQTQVRLAEILHSGSPVSPFHLRYTILSSLLPSDMNCWQTKNWLINRKLTGNFFGDWLVFQVIFQAEMSNIP